jgi:hypothetical protein
VRHGHGAHHRNLQDERSGRGDPSPRHNLDDSEAEAGGVSRSVGK